MTQIAFFHQTLIVWSFFNLKTLGSITYHGLPETFKIKKMMVHKRQLDEIAKKVGRFYCKKFYAMLTCLWRLYLFWGWNSLCVCQHLMEDINWLLPLTKKTGREGHSKWIAYSQKKKYFHSMRRNVWEEEPPKKSTTTKHTLLTMTLALQMFSLKLRSKEHIIIYDMRNIYDIEI